MLRKMFSILAALLFMTSATAAQAALVDLGIPIAPHGYPSWYQDANGLRLELCVPPPAGNASREDLCLFDPLDTSTDEEGNFTHPLIIAGESFWWLAESEIELPSGGDALLVLAVEATFGGAEEPIDGQQISFGRTRIRVDTPVAGSYTVIHPYGTQVFEVADPEEGINYTADIGAANFLSPAIGFRGTLTAPIGPFLTWPDYQNAPSLQVFATDPETGEVTDEVLEQYIGNPNVLSPVVGSPTGNNVFRIEGPAGSNLGGPGIDFVETELFAVMGKVFDPTVELTEHLFPDVPEPKLYAVGPVNRETFFTTPSVGAVTGEDFLYPVGYPLWYQEALPELDEEGNPVIDELTGLPQTRGGLRLTLCPPGDAMCISDPIDLTDALQTTLRTGGEGFWWSADARFDVPAGRAQLVLGLEATFGGDESIDDGQQIAFGRVRIRVDTAEAGTYRVTHPYGQMLFENVPADDSGINYTADIGIADPADPDGSFVGTLYSDIGPTFLTWTTFVDPATLGPEESYPEPLLVTPHPTEEGLFNYHVGNPGVEHEVVGSPFGTNYFRIEYLDDGDWELVGETNLFSVSGKLYDEATFEFAVNEAAPVVLDDTATLNVAEATSVTVNVLGNDTFLGDLAAPTVSILPPGEAFGPEEGAAVVNPDGTVTYTPNADLTAAGGTDTFAYNIVDDTGLPSNNAVVTVTVLPVETIAIDRARYRLRNLRLDLRGTSNFEGSTLTVHAGATAEDPVLGTAVVRNGRWNFRGTGTTNMSSVTVVSDSDGATTVTQTLQVR